MREIRFRAWDKIRKSMQTSRMNAVFFDGSLMLKGRDEWQSEDFILMQFTGLHDKNGVEIYEGDVLGYKKPPYGFEKYAVNNFSQKKVVKWCEWRWNVASRMTKWEVIGNIYQNPELLKDGAA